MRVHKLLLICLFVSCCVCASGKKIAATLQPVHVGVSENMRERAVHKSADIMRFRRAIEGKSMPSDGRNICESKFSGKCIDLRTETCDYPVPYDENDDFGCKAQLQSKAKTIQCCPFYTKKKKVHYDFEKLNPKRECKTSYYFYYDQPSYIFVGEHKIANGQCVDVLSNEKGCRNKKGFSRPTLTGACPGPYNIRCCPDEDWYNVEPNTNCDEQDDKELCENFKQKLRERSPKGKKHAKFGENQITFGLKEPLEGDIEWKLANTGDSGVYGVQKLKVEAISLTDDGKEVTLPFSCTGSKTDIDICWITFASSVDRHKFLYRVFQESTMDGKEFIFFDSWFNSFDVHAKSKSTGKERKFKIKFKRRISMDDKKECDSVRNVYKKRSSKSFLSSLEKVQVNSDSSMLIMDCLELAVDFEIEEIGQKEDPFDKIEFNGAQIYNKGINHRRRLLRYGRSKC